MTELAPGMSRPPLRHRVWRAVVAAIVVPASLGLLAVIPASSAYADPSCQNGGVYILFARGTNANSDGRPNFDSNEARTFKSSIQSALSRRGVQSAWAELGNLDNDWKVSSSEYPASAFGPLYWDSVRIGTDELVKHLNDRANRCTKETFVIGGYSQGADVVGWALERQGYGGLSSSARNQIGYVALYGDPKFNPGSISDLVKGNKPWWFRGDSSGYWKPPPSYTSTVLDGTFGGRGPVYLPDELRGRAGSWCANGDSVCGSELHFVLTDVGAKPHGSYPGWIDTAASEIADAAATKVADLNRTSGVPTEVF